MRNAPERAKDHTHTIALRRVIIINLVFPCILEFAHLILGGLFACLAAGPTTGFFASWSCISSRRAFWHVASGSGQWKSRRKSRRHPAVGIVEFILIYDKLLIADYP
jgi:hypothetical protein